MIDRKIFSKLKSRYTDTIKVYNPPYAGSDYLKKPIDIVTRRLKGYVGFNHYGRYRQSIHLLAPLITYKGDIYPVQVNAAGYSYITLKGDKK